jgi:hypothetical protein
MSANLPEQVRKQSKEIQALYLEMGDEAEATSEGGQPKEVEASKKTASNEAAVETTPPAGKEREAAGKTKKKEVDDFEQKYKTLQGMYNNEVPKLRQHNHELEGRLAQLESLLAGIDSTAPAPSHIEVKTGSVVTEDDIKEYGESIDVMRRVSQEEIQPIMAKLRSIESSLNKINLEVVPKVDRVHSNQAQSATQRFWDAVEAAVPNWREINVNDDFATWLFMPDPMTGNIRQDLLDDAQSKGDANRVIHIFRTWLGETGYESGTSETRTARKGQSSELENQVAPGKGRSGGQPKGEAEGSTWSRAEIAAFFKDVAKGKFKGRDEDRKKIEADIFDAQNNGRVVD